MPRKNTNKPTTQTTSTTAAKKAASKTAKTNKNPVRASKVKEIAEEVVKPVDTSIEKVSVAAMMSAEPTRKKISAPMLILGLSVLILGFLAYSFKDSFLVAVINGKPVFRYELNKKLTNSYGKETLENLIVEKLVEEEANKQKVTVTEEEINAEVDELSKSLGEETKIEDILAFQGISLEDFRHQLKLRLQVNKILEKEITISEEEIDSFIKDNASALVATDEAEKRAEAKEALMSQKTGEKIQEWVTDLLAKAKITRYIK
ncbi:MAG: SurA N-terminal domain-containing protein [Patescibacteria group bacterium]|jgi:hypothetical protein